MIDPVTEAIDLIQAAYDAPNDVYFRYESGILAFRGTEDVSDWMADAYVVMREYSLMLGSFSVPAGGVHAGFLGRWEQIRESVFAAVGDGPAPEIVTGHSLGGAIAVLAALELDVAGKGQGMVITFGAPRMGDSAFVRIVDQNLSSLTRVENWGDPVPWIPTYTRGWRHAGRTQMVGSPKNLLKWPHVKHHGLAAYREAVQL